MKKGVLQIGEEIKNARNSIAKKGVEAILDEMDRKREARIKYTEHFMRTKADYNEDDER